MTCTQLSGAPDAEVPLLLSGVQLAGNTICRHSPRRARHATSKACAHAPTRPQGAARSRAMSGSHAAARVLAAGSAGWPSAHSRMAARTQHECSGALPPAVNRRLCLPVLVGALARPPGAPAMRPPCVRWGKGGDTAAAAPALGGPGWTAGTCIGGATCRRMCGMLDTGGLRACRLVLHSSTLPCLAPLAGGVLSGCACAAGM